MNIQKIIFTSLLGIALLAACGRSQEEMVPAAADTPVETAVVEEEPTVETTEEASDEANAAQADDEETAADDAANDAAESPLAAADGAESPLSGASPLATPVVAEPPALPAETTDGGAFVGRIMLNNAAGERPVDNTIIALADVLRDEDGTPRIAGYNASAAPRTTTDELGRFAFGNVEEGTYAIILDAVITSVLLADPLTGEPILIEITTGDVTDLGRVDYESLALPGFME